jgi:hypothetical protein
MRGMKLVSYFAATADAHAADCLIVVNKSTVAGGYKSSVPHPFIHPIASRVQPIPNAANQKTPISLSYSASVSPLIAQKNIPLHISDECTYFLWMPGNSP